MATKVQGELERYFAQASFPMAMLKGAELRIIFANKGFENLFGHQASVDKALAQVTAHANSRDMVDRVYTVFRSGERYESKETLLQIKQKDGDLKAVWLSINCEPIRDEAGDIEGVLFVANDVTEQIKTRELAQESEKHFRNLVDSSPAMIWITDEHSQCTYLSQQWYEFTGRSAEQDLGVGWLENIHPDDLAETAKVYAYAVSNRGPLRVDYRLRKKSGEYRWAIDLGYPRFSSEGIFVGYIGTVTDVHDRLLVERELTQTQVRFAKSAEATDLGVWYCDLPFDELMWNKEVKNHFFLPPDARVNIELFYDHIHVADREMTRSAIQFSIDNHTPYDIIFRTVNPKRSTEVKYIRAVGWTDYDRLGMPIRFDGITLDVTREKIVQEELKEAKRQADNANEAKSAFLANMSHEIRTPLGAILGFSDLLRDKNLSAEDREQFLDTISRNGKAVTRLIDDILDLAKVESGKLEVENVEFAFVDLIQEVIDLFYDQTQNKGIFLELILKDLVPSRICSDPTRLRQILINLIGNAVKFTDKGGVKVVISSEYKANNRIAISLTVIDTGVGIPQEHRDRLFQPFMQADNTTTRKYGGTGLGLVLSSRLASALGGSIALEKFSSTKSGCTFTVNFTATGPSVMQVRTEALNKLDLKGPPGKLRLSGVKILVADDSPDNQLLVRRVLTKNGAQVETVNNGLEAFRICMKEHYDLVLMDIHMPEMDGYQATRSLREAGFSKPIIALTAHAMNEERARTREAGCNGHLTKPLNQLELIETIELHVLQS